MLNGVKQQATYYRVGGAAGYELVVTTVGMAAEASLGGGAVDAGASPGRTPGVPGR